MSGLTGFATGTVICCQNRHFTDILLPNSMPCTAAARAPHSIVDLDLTLKRLSSKRVRQIKIRFPFLLLDQPLLSVGKSLELLRFARSPVEKVRTFW